MIRHLYLLRHAETFDKELHQSDMERELTPQGINEAEKLGAQLKTWKINFDILYCSPARRTQSTASIISHSLNAKNKIVQIEPTLYHANTTDMLHLLSHGPDVFKQVAIVGHNPAISVFANHLLSIQVGGFAPCTMACIQFNIHKWREIAAHSGQLEFIHAPSIL